MARRGIVDFVGPKPAASLALQSVRRKVNEWIHQEQNRCWCVEQALRQYGPVVSGARFRTWATTGCSLVTTHCLDTCILRDSRRGICIQYL